MKEGYIVWNQTNYGEGFEVFGVFRTYEAAKKCYKKVIRDRYGNQSEDEIAEAQLIEGDHIIITHFDANKWKDGYELF